MAYGEKKTLGKAGYCGKHANGKFTLRLPFVLHLNYETI
jgi:hypothetical protein